MNIPENLYYTDNHEWVKVTDDNVAYIGISDYAQNELGDIVFVEIETEGESLEKAEAFGTVEAVKTVSDVYMPVSGEVTEFNSQLEETPELVNNDPYGEGWMIKITMNDKSELNDLLTSESYKQKIES